MDDLDGAPWWARWLAANWAIVWRQFSTWFIAAAGVIGVIPPDMWVALGFSASAQLRATAICSAIALIAKYVRQPSIEPKE